MSLKGPNAPDLYEFKFRQRSCPGIEWLAGTYTTRVESYGFEGAWKKAFDRMTMEAEVSGKFLWICVSAENLSTKEVAR